VIANNLLDQVAHEKGAKAQAATMARARLFSKIRLEIDTQTMENSETFRTCKAQKIFGNEHGKWIESP